MTALNAQYQKVKDLEAKLRTAQEKLYRLREDALLGLEVGRQYSVVVTLKELPAEDDPTNEVVVSNESGELCGFVGPEELIPIRGVTPKHLKRGDEVLVRGRVITEDRDPSGTILLCIDVPNFSEAGQPVWVREDQIVTEG